MIKILTGLLLMTAIASCRKSEIKPFVSQKPLACELSGSGLDLHEEKKPKANRLRKVKHVKNVLYLDFDGHFVSGTTFQGNGTAPFYATPSGMSEAGKIEVYEYVADAFENFKVLVTTDSTIFLKAEKSNRMRVIITETVIPGYSNSSGVAYTNSFNWDDDTPAFVFSALLSSHAGNVARSVVHESGHTLGLWHQSVCENGSKVAEYNTGDSVYAPYMGRAVGKIGKWWVGTDQYCGIQNDSLIMVQNLN